MKRIYGDCRFVSSRTKSVLKTSVLGLETLPDSHLRQEASCFHSCPFVSLLVLSLCRITKKLQNRFLWNLNGGRSADPTLWDCFNIFVHFSWSDALISMKLWRISGRINLDLWIFSFQSLKSLREAGQTQTWRWRDKTPGCTLSSRCKSCPGELRRKVDVYL